MEVGDLLGGDKMWVEFTGEKIGEFVDLLETTASTQGPGLTLKDTREIEHLRHAVKIAGVRLVGGRPQLLSEIYREIIGEFCLRQWTAEFQCGREKRATIVAMDESSKRVIRRGSLDPKNKKRREDLERSLSYHRPTDEQTARIERLRAAQKAYVEYLMDLTFPSREQTEAITCFE